MKKIYKCLFVSALSAFICLSLTLTASAQHDHGSGGGGGGGSRPSGGGGGSFSSHASVAPARSAPSSSSARPSTVQRTYSSSRASVAQRNIVSQNPTAHIGTNVRSGATAQNYRSYQGSVYSRNHPISPSAYNRPGFNGSANRGYYHYNHGYYGSYYTPRLGFSIGFLPYGYYPFYFDDYQWFYSDGLFYQYDNDQYTVVEPPVGAEVTSLPSNAQSIVINGQQYYEVNGVYYQPITKDDGTLSYQVAGKDGELNTTDDSAVDAAPRAPQIGDIVNDLPPNCHKININGDKLFVSPDGIYYKVQLNPDNTQVYKIVGLPADDDQGQGGGQGGN
jgi:hypothetical protein